MRQYTFSLIFVILVLSSCQIEEPMSPEFDEAYQAAGKHKFDSIELSITYCKTAIKLADEAKNLKLLGKAYWMMGYLHDLNGDVSRGVHYYDAASDVYEHLENFEISVALLQNSGALLMGADIPKLALRRYRICQSKLDQFGVESRRGSVFYDLGTVHKKLNNMDSAYYYQLLAYDYSFEKTDLKFDILNELGLIQTRVENYDTARMLFNQALEQNKSGSSQQYKIANNIANSYLEEGRRLDSGLFLFHKTIPLAENIGWRALIKPLNGLAKTHYKLNNFDSASIYFKKSISYNAVSSAYESKSNYENDLSRSTSWDLGIAHQYLKELDVDYDKEVVQPMIVERFTTVISQFKQVEKKEIIRTIELDNVNKLNNKLAAKLKSYELAHNRKDAFNIIAFFLVLGTIVFVFRKIRNTLQREKLKRIVQGQQMRQKSKNRLSKLTSR